VVGQRHSRGHADKQWSNVIFFALFIYGHDGTARSVIDEAREKSEVRVFSGSQSVQDILMGGKDIGRTFSHRVSFKAQRKSRDKIFHGCMVIKTNRELSSDRCKKRHGKTVSPLTVRGCKLPL